MTNLDHLPLWTRKLAAGRLQRLSPGMGCCGRSGIPWSHVTSHDTRYTDHRSCFPLCESCWSGLRSPDRRLRYYQALWLDWQRFPNSNGEDYDEVWSQIHDAVMAGN